MQTIFKFVLKNEVAEVEMPVGAQILHVAEQHNDICIWAQVDSEAAKETRYFIIYGTGHRMMNCEHKFIGTMLTAGGHLVWHLFELPNGFPKEPYRNEH
jgi:hypothetical protein